MLASLDLQAVYLGDRLGLYRALEEGGPATPPELAERAGIDPRYAREWLEHQAVGLDPRRGRRRRPPPDERRYTLPAGHAAVLTDPESLALVAPLARFVVGTAKTMPKLLDAYRTGDGVDWADYGPDVVEAQEGINRPQFHHLVGEWIDALPDIAERLRSGTGRVADVACGTGWSSIAIARHFPGVEVDGIDIDEGSIARAKAHAAEAGVDGRVSFLFADAASGQGEGRYDLVTIFEALHDMARPAEVLAAARDCSRPAARCCRRRARRGDVHRPGRRGRAAVLRLQRGGVSRQRPGRQAERRDGHRDPAVGRPGDGARGRFQRLHDPSDASTRRSASTVSIPRRERPLTARTPVLSSRARSGGPRAGPPADLRVRIHSERSVSRPSAGAVVRRELRGG